MIRSEREREEPRATRRPPEGDCFLSIISGQHETRLARVEDTHPMDRVAIQLAKLWFDFWLEKRLEIPF